MERENSFDIERIKKKNGNDRIYDNFYNEYVYVSKNSGWFLFQRVVDGKFFYFDKDGVMINHENTYLEIERDVDFEKCDMIISEDFEKAYIKLSDGRYFTFFVNNDNTNENVPKKEVIDNPNYYFKTGFWDFNEADYKQRETILKKLHDYYRYGYNTIKKEIVNIPSSLKKGGYYTVNNSVFKSCSDMDFDLLGGLSIPYEFLVELKTEFHDGALLYENGLLGLPPYTPVRESTEDEIIMAEEIYDRNVPSIKNVIAMIGESKGNLDKMLEMLRKIENGRK